MNSPDGDSWKCKGMYYPLGHKCGPMAKMWPFSEEFTTLGQLSFLAWRGMGVKSARRPHFFGLGPLRHLGPQPSWPGIIGRPYDFP